MPAELRRFLLAAPNEWRSVWIVATFAGLRPGELQAMAWTDQNWPDFTANKIHVNYLRKSPHRGREEPALHRPPARA